MENDSDGSFIKLVDILPGFHGSTLRSTDDAIFATLAPPRATKQSVALPPVLHAIFLGTQSGSTCSIEAAKAAISWLIAPAALDGGIFSKPEIELAIVLGFDTETGVRGVVSLIQLCAFGGPEQPGRILVAHMRSGIFETVGAFLAGRADWLDSVPGPVRPICAAAEVAGDVLLLLADAKVRVAAALDLTDATSGRQRALGLRQMLNDATGSDWVKRKEVTCSDWDALPLSLAQLKYAALDAWASEVLGRAAVQRPAFRAARRLGTAAFAAGGLLGAPPLFSSTQLPRALAVALLATLKEAQAYQDAGKAAFEVDVTGVTVDAKDPRCTRVALGSFNKRLRNQSRVEARCKPMIGFGGGAARLLSGVVKSVVGRLATISWRQGDAAAVTAAFKGHRLVLESDNFADVDKSIQVAKVALLKVVKAFRMTPLGEDPPLVIDCSTGREAIERFEELPSTVRELLLSSALGVGIRLLLGASEGLENIAVPIEGPPPSAKLNLSQRAAVDLGLTRHISLVRGPPGTGKTSTVAAFAGAVVAGGGRVLIIAPANAATLRVLESVVAQNLLSVALVASKEWMLEWHQDSVHAHLQPFVITPEVLDVRKQKERQKLGEYANSGNKHGSDLNDRAVAKPKSKWDAALDAALAAADDASSPPLAALDVPGIVIMTHGSFVAMSAGGGKWTSMLSKLISTNRIDAVVVDECSQLWEGHAPALFASFKPSAHFLLVGDDRQLPPFGSDAATKIKASSLAAAGAAGAASSRSLFDAARGCTPTVPVTQLSISYRLTRPVGELLSSAFYEGELAVVRNDRRDALIRARVSKGLGLLPSHIQGDTEFAQAVVEASLLGPQATGFIWLHVTGSRTKVGKSSANEAEARVVSRIVPALLCALRSAEQMEGITDGYGSDVATAWAGFEDQGGDIEDVSSLQGSDHESSDEFEVLSRPLPLRIADRDADRSSACEEDEEGELSLTLSALKLEKHRRSAENLPTAEAEQAAVELSRAHLEAAASGTGQRSRLCVVTPYEGQRALVETSVCDALRRGYGRHTGLSDDLSVWVRASRTVGNVDALQGQEADLCVVSAVRAPQPGGGGGNQHGLGFLDDNRRTNVMLSRAQQLLVIVGDAEAWFRGPPGSLLRAFAAKSLADGTCFGVEGEFEGSTAPAEGVPPSLMRMGLGSNMPTSAASLEDIWKAPLPDFVPCPPGREGRRNRTKKPAAAKAPRQSNRSSNASAGAGNSNRGSATGGGSGTFGGPVAQAPASKAPKQSNRGSDVAAGEGSSSQGGATGGGRGNSGGPKSPTPGALVAAMQELSRKYRNKFVPGIILMKRFPQGSWKNTTQAAKAFEAAGLRLGWQGSTFTVTTQRKAVAQHGSAAHHGASAAGDGAVTAHAVKSGVPRPRHYATMTKTQKNNWKRRNKWNGLQDE